MYDALSLQILAEGYRDGDEEYSYPAVNKVAEKHCKKGQQRVHSDSIADDLGLDYLAYNTYHAPDDEKPHALSDVTRQHAYHRPRTEYGPGTDDGEDVEHRDPRGNAEGAFLSDAEEPYRKLDKGDEHYHKV